jgi:hypothetical protein
VSRTEDEKLHARISAKVFEAEGSECWLWTGAVNEKGYGVINVNGVPRLVHRIVYDLVVADIPPGHVIRHSCHNPPCCRPSHLSTGTHRDNSDDSAARRRQRFHRLRQAEAEERHRMETDPGFVALSLRDGRLAAIRWFRSQEHHNRL